MNEGDKATLRRLLPMLLDLLEGVASGELNAWEVDVDYQRLHTDVRALLTKDKLDCICPWPTIHGWAGKAPSLANQDGGWSKFLVDRSRNARLACGLEKPPPWKLVDYQRKGNPKDTPFWSEFANQLEPHKQAILKTWLEGVLQERGTSICDDSELGHSWQCSGTRGNTTKVFMGKLKRGHALGEVVLRVFFITGEKRQIVLLSGYDKGADADPDSEAREAKRACNRRKDHLEQLEASRERKS